MIFCVEDDAGIRDLMIYTLNASGFQAAGFESARELYSALADTVPELILLDIMLPGEDGISVLKRLKADQRTADIPVIMATAKGNEYDKVIGLDLGADDYVPKTFSARELLARIRVVLRRMENAGLPEGSDRQDGMLCMHGLCMNPQTLKVTLNNEPLDLTSMEFQLLYHLARGAGRIFSREDLLNLFAEKEWNKFDRCVDVHISSLRKKLGDNSRCPTYLKTVRGLGYMFIKQSDAWP